VGVFDLAIVIVDNGLGFIHATLHLFPLAGRERKSKRG
jgi:hypothetical protein